MTLGLRIQSRLWLVCLGLGAVSAPIYVIGSTTHKAVLVIAFSVFATVAIPVGVWLRRPLVPLAWLVLGCSVLSWTIGWVLWERHILAHGVAPATSSFVNLFFLCAYPSLAGVFIYLLRRRERDVIGLIDVGIVALGLGMVAWVLLADSYVSDSSVPLIGRSVQSGYVLFDVLILAALLRVVASPGLKSPAFWLLTGAAAAWLASDGIWDWLTPLGDYMPGSWADLGWLISSGLVAAAALHPSAPRLFAREIPVARRLRWDRIAFTVAALLVGPVLLMELDSVHEKPGEVFPVLAGTVGVVLLVVARMAISLRVEETITAKLARRNERLRELDRMKDDFVASVSHELRTPLTSIRGYTELVLDGEAGHVTEDQRRFLEVVDRNSERLLNLVGDLLFVAQVDREELSLQLDEVELTTIAAEAVEGLRPRAAELDLQLALDAEAIQPIRGDRARLAQLVDNLVSNALKFTPAGGRVELRVSTLSDRAVLEVADTGIGISADDRKRLFERFYRTDMAKERAIQGTGLGLAIAKAIVEAHGGRIGVESEEGTGTTFRVELPLVPTQSIHVPTLVHESQGVRA